MYKEVNPAVFACVSFPFLFGVMFGDLGHGGIVFLFSAYLCMFKEKIEKAGGVLSSFLPARYLFLLMGFFGAYNGLIYNELFAFPIEASWGSCYTADLNQNQTFDLRYDDCVYPFGMDPRWS